MFGFIKTSVSDRKLSKLMYAILITNSKLVSSHHLSLERFTRKQNGGNCIDVVVEVAEGKVKTFEELAGVKLKTSKEFQGTMTLN